VDQLQLGDKVESPDAVNLPLKLAVSLLKDRNGVIDLDCPSPAASMIRSSGSVRSSGRYS